MNTFTTTTPARFIRSTLASVLFALVAISVAHAGLTFDLRLIREQQGTSYNFYTEMETNSTLPAAPLGNYLIASPQQPTNGSWRQFEMTTNGFNFTGGGSSSYGDFDSVMQQITNGNWTILFTNATTTNHFRFTVSAPSMTSNLLPVLIVTVPTEGAILLTNQPTFAWQWPAGWGVNSDAFVFNNDFSFFQYASLPEAQNTWFMSTPLPSGENVHFQLRYTTNYAPPLFVATTPIETNSAQPISGWISTSGLTAIENVNFSVSAASPAIGHTLRVHHTFDNSGDPGVDDSGNGNDISCGSSWALPVHEFNPNAAAGAGALRFYGNSSLTPCDPSQAFTTWRDVLAGSFTFSAWVNTTASSGNDTDNAVSGAAIFWAYNDQYNTNDTIPIAITGSKAAFTTRDQLGNSQTLHSTLSVNDGNYHLLTVTRDGNTGEKKIYVDGNLEASEVGTTEPLNGNNFYFSIGGTTISSYSGLLDDPQIYAGVLSGSEVAYLYTHPGTNVPDTTGQDFNAALNTTNLTWTTGGNLPWFVETTNTHDSVSAARSGAITNDTQSSYLETTVTGPGTLSFWWQTAADDLDFEIQLKIDGNYLNNIYGNTSWTHETYSIGPGQHTLRWVALAYSVIPETDAGYLDEVSYVVTTVPIITANPFNQTNHPGYQVALLAAATSNAAINWAWYKVGDAAPIPNATNALYIPTNAGTPSVAGSYYAVASNPAGVANTLTAAVTFVSAPLPPDWSRAFKSPSVNNNAPTEEYYLDCLPDSAGNLYSVGSFTGTNVFGTNTFFTAPGAYSTLIVKQTATGGLIWARAITNLGNGNSYAQVIAPAPSDGIYVTGNFSGTNWLGTNVLMAVETSMYLTRLDANGNPLWVRTIVGTKPCFTGFHQMVADPAGLVTVSCLIWGTVSFGSTNVTVSGQEGVLAQYDASGSLRWLEQPSGWFTYLTLAAGRIYGSMGGPATSYVGGLTNTSDRAWNLVALNATNGQAYWLTGIASALGQGNPLGLGDDTPAVAVAGTNVFVVGTGWGSNVSFGPYSVSWPSPNGQYFARYSTDGTPQLASAFGSPTTQPWTALADGSGNVFVGGDFDFYSVFGSNILAAPRYETIGNGFYGQAFLAKFDRNGNSLWARKAESPAIVGLRGIALAPDGIWATGFCRSSNSLPTVFGSNQVQSSLEAIPGLPFVIFVWHTSGYLAKITDGAAAALPVTLVNPKYPGSSFQFSFTSQSGFTHTVLYRTNLTLGSWQTNTSVAGDGTLKTISVPLTLFGGAKQGFVRVATQ